MKAVVNGEVREFAGGLTLSALLHALGVPEKGIAVARNERVVRRNALEQERVEEGDRIEIIRAVAGG